MMPACLLLLPPDSMERNVVGRESGRERRVAHGAAVLLIGGAVLYASLQPVGIVRGAPERSASGVPTEPVEVGKVSAAFHNEPVPRGGTLTPRAGVTNATGRSSSHAATEHSAAALAPGGPTPPGDGQLAFVSTAPFPPAVEQWRALATAATRLVAEREGVVVEPNLLLALVLTESSGDPEAVSAVGAVGLTQLRAAAFAEAVSRHPSLFPRRDRRDPAENLLAGALYLVRCARYLAVDLDQEDGLRLALHAYNLGPGAMRSWRERGWWSAEVDAERRIFRELPHQTRVHAERTLSGYVSARPA